MQTSIQKSGAVRFGSGVLEMSTDDGSTWANLGGLRDGALNLTKQVTELVLDNAKADPQARIEEVVFSARLYEVHLPIINTIDGISTLTTATGATTNVPNEEVFAIEDGVALLAQSSGENVEITNVDVQPDGGGTPFVVDVDYTIVVQDGRTGITTINGGGITEGASLDVAYDWSIKTANLLTFKDQLLTLSKNRFRFTNTDANGAIFRVEFLEGYNRAGMELAFLPDDTTDDAMNLTVEIKAFPRAVDDVLFTIYDEQSVV